MEFNLIINEEIIKIKEGMVLSFKESTRKYIITDISKVNILSRYSECDFTLRFANGLDNTTKFSRYRIGDIVHWLSSNGQITNL
jgi:hypothetical protein